MTLRVPAHHGQLHGGWFPGPLTIVSRTSAAWALRSLSVLAPAGVLPWLSLLPPPTTRDSGVYVLLLFALLGTEDRDGGAAGAELSGRPGLCQFSDSCLPQIFPIAVYAYSMDGFVRVNGWMVVG